MRLAMAIFFAIAALMPQRAGAAKVAADTLSIRDVFANRLRSLKRPHALTCLTIGMPTASIRLSMPWTDSLG